MIKGKFVKGIVAGAAASVVCATVSFAGTGGGNCSKAIDKENSKIEAAAFKAFNACNDAYWKDALAKTPQPPTYAKAAPSCEKALGKLVATVGKEEPKTAALAPSKSCTDADLGLLGHLPTGTFGSKWAEYQATVAVQFAYEQQISAVRNFVTQLLALEGTGSCPTCVKFDHAPCQEATCNYLGAGSQAIVGLNGLPPIPVPLIGVAALRFCDATPFLPSTSNTLYISGATGKNIQPAPVGSISFACPVSIGAEGFVTCGGSASKVSYTTCQDHNVPSGNASGATTSGGCTGEDTCQASNVDVDDPTVTNGGACIKATSGAGVLGDAYVNNTTQIRLTNTSDGPGADGLYCTEDDPSLPGTPATTPLTTGTANAIVHNVDDQAGIDLISAPVTGSPFSCPKIGQGILTGAKLVGAFPAMNTIAVAPGVNLDSTTGFELTCQ
jgi:hypothetical protein